MSPPEIWQQIQLFSKTRPAIRARENMDAHALTRGVISRGRLRGDLGTGRMMRTGRVARKAIACVEAVQRSRTVRLMGWGQWRPVTARQGVRDFLFRTDFR